MIQALVFLLLNSAECLREKESKDKNFSLQSLLYIKSRRNKLEI